MSGGDAHGAQVVDEGGHVAALVGDGRWAAADPGEGGSDEIGNQPHATALSGAVGAGELLPMRGADEDRAPVPLASRER